MPQKITNMSWCKVKLDPKEVAVEQRLNGPIVLRLYGHVVLQDYYPCMNVCCAGFQAVKESICHFRVDGT
jgi:hypothetical protein